MKKAAQLLFLMAALAGMPGRTVAQTADTTAVEQVQETGTSNDAAFPVRDTAPRLQRAYLHVFLAFGIAWLLIFAYAVTLGRRFNRLERELERFRQVR